MPEAENEKKRLLVIASTFPRWPGDTSPPFVYELCRRLTGDFEVHVLAPAWPGARDAEEMDGVAVHRFRYFFRPLERLAGATGILPTIRKKPVSGLLVPFFLLGELVALFRLVRKLRPAAIHAHWLIPQGVAAALAGRFAGVPFLVTCHGGDVFGLRMAPAVAAKRMVLRRAAAVTVVSRAMAAAVEGLAPVAAEVVPMGVDSRLFHGRGDGAVRKRFGINGPFFLFVGRLSEKKGVRYLIEAMAGVAARRPDARLLIVGRGEEEASLKELCRSLGLDGVVIFAGALPNHELPAVYADADVFVGPSIRARGGDTEGFGLTFVEAGMSGCILVGSDVGGIGDIITPGETGFLVPEKDSAALAETLAMVLERKEEWPAMRRRAREEFVGRFDWRVISREYGRIIGEIGR